MPVLDAAGGAGGTASSTGTTSSKGSTGTITTSTTATGTRPLTCDELYASYSAALQVAMSCDICDDGPDPCGRTNQYVADPCGCPAPVNVQTPDALAAAVAAYVAWTDSGCGPYECGQPCVISSEPRC